MMRRFVLTLRYGLRPEKEKPSPIQLRAKDNLNTMIAGTVLVVLLAALTLLSFHGRDRVYSENENRYLEARPKFTASSVFEGKYMQHAEAYLSDHFFARDSMVKARTRLDIFFGKKEINNIYVGKEHFLFEKPAAYDEERVGKTLRTVNDVTAANASVPSYFALVPDSCEILSDLMPANAPGESQAAQIEKVYGTLQNMHCLDMVTPLRQADDKTSLYYKTDHHWTTGAARLAFAQIAADMQLPTDGVEYTDYCVTNSFQGTLASSTGLFRAQDSIFITVPEPGVEYVVTYVDENEKRPTLFDSAKLEEKSRYDVFFGGNFAQVKMETSADSDRVLLLIKDSYANCMVPMLLPYYKKIIMIDPRYYTDNLQQTIEKEGPTEILWLYNVNTFLTDTAIVSTFG